MVASAAHRHTPKLVFTNYSSFTWVVLEAATGKRGQSETDEYRRLNPSNTIYNQPSKNSNSLRLLIFVAGRGTYVARARGQTGDP